MTKLAPPGTLTALSSLFRDSKANMKPTRIKDNSPSHSYSHPISLRHSLPFSTCPLPCNRSSQSIPNAQHDVMCLLSASMILSTGIPQLFTNSSESLHNHYNSSTASSIYSISSQGFILSLRLFLLFLEFPRCRQLRRSLLPLRHDRRHCYAGQTATRQLCRCGCR